MQTFQAYDGCVLDVTEHKECGVGKSTNFTTTSTTPASNSVSKWSSIEEGFVFESKSNISVKDSKNHKDECHRKKTWVVLPLILFSGVAILLQTMDYWHLETVAVDDLNQVSGGRRLSRTKNVFLQPRYSSFLVQWGVARRGCRPPPQALLRLSCQGGRLQVLYSYLACLQTSPEGAECPLSHSSTELNGAEWTQGMVVARCYEDSSRRQSVPEFHATFDMATPSVCSGIQKNETEDGVAAVGGYENYLFTSQLCAKNNDDDDVQYLPVSSCSTGEELQFESFENSNSNVCRSTDFCCVPKCPDGFRCKEDGFMCKVKPVAIELSPKSVNSCQDLGLIDVKDSERLWSVVQSQGVTPERLSRVGVGVGPMDLERQNTDS